jgi:hypothetical protein
MQQELPAKLLVTTSQDAINSDNVVSKRVADGQKTKKQDGF